MNKFEKKDISIIKFEGIIGGLTGQWRWHDQSLSIVVKIGVHHWSHHVGEDVLANEVNRVLNDHDGEINELVHYESDKLVIVVEVRVAELDVAVLHDWVQISVLVKHKVGYKVKGEVLEDELDVTLTWQDPGVDFLVGLDLPALEGGELELNERPIVVPDELKLDVVDVQFSSGVGDVLPLDVPAEQVKEHINLVLVLLWELIINVKVVWEEILHCLLESNQLLLPETKLHTRVHSDFVFGHCLLEEGRAILDVDKSLSGKQSNK